jgi:hypothetical protein
MITKTLRPLASALACRMSLSTYSAASQPARVQWRCARGSRNGLARFRTFAAARRPYPAPRFVFTTNTKARPQLLVGPQRRREGPRGRHLHAPALTTGDVQPALCPVAVRPPVAASCPPPPARACAPATHPRAQASGAAERRVAPAAGVGAPLVAIPIARADAAVGARRRPHTVERGVPACQHAPPQLPGVLGHTRAKADQAAAHA